jgi:hypothetical protein
VYAIGGLAQGVCVEDRQEGQVEMRRANKECGEGFEISVLLEGCLCRKSGVVLPGKINDDRDR